MQSTFYINTSVAGGTTYTPTVPPNEIWWTTWLSGAQSNGYIYSSAGVTSGAIHGGGVQDSGTAMKNAQNKISIPWTNPAPRLIYGTTGASAVTLAAHGVRLDATTEPYTVKVLYGTNGTSSTFVNMGAVPAGKAWCIIAVGVAGMNPLYLYDPGDATRASFVNGPNIDTQGIRTGKKVWLFNDSPWQEIYLGYYSGYTSYSTVVVLEYTAAGLDEYNNRWSAKTSVAANASYDVRPPVGEAWVMDMIDATIGNFYFVDGGGVETLITAYNGATSDALKAFGQLFLNNDYYLRYKPGTAAGTFKAQGIKDKL